MKKLVFTIDEDENYAESKREMDQAYHASKAFLFLWELSNQVLRGTVLENKLESKFQDRDLSEKEWDLVFETMEFILDEYGEAFEESGIPDDLLY